MDQSTHSRQRETKLTKTGSQFFRMLARSLDPGFRLRPLLLVMQRGLPLESAESVVGAQQRESNGLNKDQTVRVVIKIKSKFFLARRDNAGTRQMKLTEEKAFPGRVSDDVLRWCAQHFHDAGQLFDFVLSGEDGVASVQLGQDATCAC